LVGGIQCPVCEELTKFTKRQLQEKDRKRKERKVWGSPPREEKNITNQKKGL